MQRIKIHNFDSQQKLH